MGAVGAAASGGRRLEQGASQHLAQVAEQGPDHWTCSKIGAGASPMMRAPTGIVIVEPRP